MAEFRVRAAKPIACSVTVPGDAIISQLSLLLAALADGVSRLDGIPVTDESRCLVRALRALGVRVDGGDTAEAAGAEPPTAMALVVHGTAGRFQAPSSPIEGGASVATMRLLAGVLAAQPFRSELSGGPGISGEMITPVIESLVRMGARIETADRGGRRSLAIGGGPLRAVSWPLPDGDVVAKAALMLAALRAEGKSVLTEPAAMADHPERVLEAFGVALRREGRDIIVHGGQQPDSREYTVPGEIASAACWLTAAAIQPGSELQVVHVGLNPTRTGVLRVLARMGASIQEIVETKGAGEPAGRIILRGARLRATSLGGAEFSGVAAEMPFLAVAAALAEGTTVIEDDRDRREVPSDRLAGVARLLRAFGVTVRERTDGLEIDGPTRLRAPRQPVAGEGDAGLAMAAALAGLFADGTTVVSGVEGISLGYPGFACELARFQTEEVMAEERVPVVSGVGGARPQVVVKFDQPKSGIVIAIDGPAASGKSSVSRDLARCLGFVHVNSGAIYRAVTRAVLEAGIDPDNAEAVAAHLHRLRIECGQRDGEGTIEVNGTVAEGLNAAEVNAAVSAVARVPAVRAALYPLQRRYATIANIVMEGRDIGSAIFPETPYKYYVDASPEVRARRRAAQGLADSVLERDRQDSSRTVAPLRQAEGSLVIDSSNLTVEKVVDRIVDDLRARGLVV